MPVWIALLALSGCKKEQDEPGEGVFYDVDARELVFERDGEVLLRFPTDGLQLGEVAALDDGRSYDPWWDDNTVQWRAVQSAEAIDGGVRLTFDHDVGATLTITEVAEDRWSLHLDPDDDVPIAYHRLRPRIDPSEGLYGLGEVFDTPNHRGKSRAMQIELDVELESANNEAHVPVPLLIGTRGWGLFVEDHHPGRFDCATDADDVVEVTYGTGMDSADGLRFHLFAADHPLDVTAHYYATTGALRLPARWALGPWIWRDENRDQAQVEEDIGILRDLDLATNGIWVDRPYATGVNTFDFEASKFPDPQGMVDAAHAAGLRVALWHTPYVDPDSAAELNAVAEDSGYFPPIRPPAFVWSHPIDFTNPEAYAWWQGLIGNYTDLGIEGYKLDYAEEVLVIGAAGGRLPWGFADGSDERTMHAVYQLWYHQVYAETLPSDGGFLLTRTGRWGDQVNGPIIWPGDIDADFSVFREERVDDEGGSYVAVGGLPSAVVASNSLGPSGFPFFGSDTGGYRHAPPDKETFTRWFQHTALSSVMQVGTNSNDVPWEFLEDNGFDEEMLGWYREYARLHLRLWPYAWTYAEQIAQTGRPLQRPLGLAYPDLGVHPTYDYLFGDHLLVAPVVERGATTRDVQVPPGDWVHWFTGEVVQGPGVVTVDAPLDELPLFIRAGGIVPMLRPTIDTLAPSTDAEVDSYANDPGELWARIVPGEASSFALFDGSELTQAASGGEVEVTWSSGAEFSGGAVIELVGFLASAVEVDGSAATENTDFYVSDDATWLFVPAGTHTVVAR